VGFRKCFLGNIVSLNTLITLYFAQWYFSLFQSSIFSNRLPLVCLSFQQSMSFQTGSHLSSHFRSSFILFKLAREFSWSQFIYKAPISYPWPLDPKVPQTGHWRKTLLYKKCPDGWRKLINFFRAAPEPGWLVMNIIWLEDGKINPYLKLFIRRTQ